MLVPPIAVGHAVGHSEGQGGQNFVTTPFGGMPADIAERLRTQERPEWRSPMLATLTEDRFSDPNWIYERKFDGIRLLAFRDGDGCGCVPATTWRWKPRIRRSSTLAAQASSGFAIDGEVVAFEGRRTSFERCKAAPASMMPRRHGPAASPSTTTFSTSCISTATT